jgi:hypothetical protein
MLNTRKELQLLQFGIIPNILHICYEFFISFANFLSRPALQNRVGLRNAYASIKRKLPTTLN